MNRKLKQWLQPNTLLVVLIGALLIYIIFTLSHTHHLYYPDPYFEHRASYRNFHLYSDRPIDLNITRIIDEVSVRMQPVDEYNPEAEHHVYLTNDPATFGIFARELNLSTTVQALTINPMGYILVNMTAVEHTRNIYRDRYPHTLYHGDLAYIISHELMHVLTTRELGFVSSWFLPRWKREGYAEYGASLNGRIHNPSYSLADRTLRFLNGFYEELSDNQRFYIRSSLICEYLIDVEGMTFGQLIDSPLHTDSVFVRLKNWAHTGVEKSPPVPE